LTNGEKSENLTDNQRRQPEVSGKKIPRFSFPRKFRGGASNKSIEKEPDLKRFWQATQLGCRYIGRGAQGNFYF
jgi:hypothetical protein